MKNIYGFKRNVKHLKNTEHTSMSPDINRQPDVEPPKIDNESPGEETEICGRLDTLYHSIMTGDYARGSWEI